MSPALIITGLNLLSSLVGYLQQKDKDIPPELLEQRKELRKLLVEQAGKLTESTDQDEE